MDIKEYICVQMEHLKRGTTRVLNGLTEAEVAWRPGPQANSIGLLLFHAARFEDFTISSKVLEKPALWESEKWYEKLKMPVNETGAGYTAEQIVGFVAPNLQDLRAYYDAVRANTVTCVQNLPPEKLDKKIALPFGEFSLGSLFALIINHQAQHLGEISYIRGLQRGMNK
jgi:hypothetical protein